MSVNRRCFPVSCQVDSFSSESPASISSGRQHDLAKSGTPDGHSKWLVDSGRQTGFEWSCKSWVVVSQLQNRRNHPSHPLSYWILPVLPGIIKAMVSSFKAAVHYHPGTFQQIRGHLRVCNIKHRLWSHPLYYFLVEADHLVWINCQVRLSYFSMSKIVPFHTKLEHTPKPVPTRYKRILLITSTSTGQSSLTCKRVTPASTSVPVSSKKIRLYLPKRLELLFLSNGTDSCFDLS